MNGNSAHLRLIQDRAHDGAFNMAVDEFFLRRQIQMQDRNPILRVYRFSEPTMTVGYGLWRTLLGGTNGGMPTIRRMTGGGAVLHNESDLTYSLIVSLSEQKPLRKVKESYFFIHEALRKTLNYFGIRAELFGKNDNFPLHLSSPSAKAQTGKEEREGLFCFDSPVLHDVMLSGEKVAGAGQKRTLGYLLHQGSIAWGVLMGVNPGLSEARFSEQFSVCLSRLLDLPVKEMSFDAEELRGTLTPSLNGYAGTNS